MILTLNSKSDLKGEFSTLQFLLTDYWGSPHIIDLVGLRGKRVSKENRVVLFEVADVSLEGWKKGLASRKTDPWGPHPTGSPRTKPARYLFHETSAAWLSPSRSPDV